MFMFALANGLCEAVINPLVATLYSMQKTHYLNILHAGWPGGLVIGGLGAYCFVGNDAAIVHLRWEIPMAIFLIPTLAYGILTIIEKFPVSERESGRCGSILAKCCPVHFAAVAAFAVDSGHGRLRRIGDR